MARLVRASHFDQKNCALRDAENALAGENILRVDNASNAGLSASKKTPFVNGGYPLRHARRCEATRAVPRYRR